jgi:hypothetical protein
MKGTSRYSSHLLSAIVGIALILQGTSIGTASSQQRTPVAGIRGREVYTGTIVYFPDIRSPRTTTVTTTFNLTLESQTTASELSQFDQRLRDDGQDGLMKVISSGRHGRLQIGGNVGRDIGFVQVSPSEEGRKYTIILERWINFSEARRGTRSLDYPFTYIELYVDDKGKGDGMMFSAARIRFKENSVEVENFATYPAKLMGVTRRS